MFKKYQKYTWVLTYFLFYYDFTLYNIRQIKNIICNSYMCLYILNMQNLYTSVIIYFFRNSFLANTGFRLEIKVGHLVFYNGRKNAARIRIIIVRKIFGSMYIMFKIIHIGEMRLW